MSENNKPENEGRGSSSTSTSTPKTARLRRFAVPIATLMLLVLALIAYYLFYVQNRREYLINRNFRNLAILGNQIADEIENQGSILSTLVDDLINSPTRYSGKSAKAELKQTEFDDQNKEYAAFLNPNLHCLDVTRVEDDSVVSPTFGMRLINGDWSLGVSVRRKVGISGTYVYSGCVRVEDMVAPFLTSDTFDDVMIASSDGTIIYQRAKTGPQFTTLSELLSNAVKPLSVTGDKQSGQKNLGIASQDKQAIEKVGIERSTDRELRVSSTHLVEVALAGSNYLAFMQPALVGSSMESGGKHKLLVEAPAQELVVCGLLKSQHLDWESLSISYRVVIVSTALLLIVFFLAPFFKIFFLNNRERLHLGEMALLPIAVVLLAGCLTFLFTQFVYFQAKDSETTLQLHKLADNMAAQIAEELRRMHQQLKQICEDPGGQLAQDLSSSGKTMRWEVLTDELRYQALPYPFFENVFFTTPDGEQLIKWSARNFSTPMVSGLWRYPYVQRVQRRDLFHLDEKRAFVVQSVLAPNKADYVAVLAMPARDCIPPSIWSAALLGENPEENIALKLNPMLNDKLSHTPTGEPLAVISSRALTLVDPLLPTGFGFALIDSTGDVLFHSDKTRNNRENLFLETDGNRDLYAAVFGHARTEPIRLHYLGADSVAIVKPIEALSGARFSLVVFREMGSVRTVNLLAITLAAFLFGATLAVPLIIGILVFLIRWPVYIAGWLVPRQSDAPIYRFQIALCTAMGSLLVLMAYGFSLEQTLVAAFLVPNAVIFLLFWSGYAFGENRPKHARRWFLGTAVAFVAAIVWIAIEAKSWQPAVVIGVAAWAAIPLIRHHPERWWPTCWTYRRLRIPDRYCYPTRSVLTVLVIAVLPCLAWFHLALAAETRLDEKQSQLHMARAFQARTTMISNLPTPGWEGLRSSVDGKNRLETSLDRFDSAYYNSTIISDEHRPATGNNKFQPWFAETMYKFHQTFNQAAAESLAVIADRLNSVPSDEKRPYPDWQWTVSDDRISLRVHGVESMPRPDVVVESEIPIHSAWKQAGAGAVISVVTCMLVGWLMSLVNRKLFVNIAEKQLCTTRAELLEAIRTSDRLLILIPSWDIWVPLVKEQTIDVRAITSGSEWDEAYQCGELAPDMPCIIEHFEYGLNDPECNRQKLALLRKLLAEGQCVALVSTVDVTQQLADLPWFEPVVYEGEGEQPNPPDEWPEVLRVECAPSDELSRIGARLAANSECRSTDREALIREVLERATGYYRGIWSISSNAERFVLHQLAADGIANPLNTAALSELLRRGLIVKQPQFRIMNESFRRFVLSAPSPEELTAWHLESSKEGWGRIQSGFIITFVLLAGFLVATQQEFFQSWLGYITAAIGGVGTLFQMLNSLRGKVTGTRGA